MSASLEDLASINFFFFFFYFSFQNRQYSCYLYYPSVLNSEYMILRVCSEAVCDFGQQRVNYLLLICHIFPQIGISSMRDKKIMIILTNVHLKTLHLALLSVYVSGILIFIKLQLNVKSTLS